jgi:hypothetical protein
LSQKRNAQPIPEEYHEAYLCDLLGLSYTELCEQPAWWVVRMKTWKEAKAKARNEQEERERRKNKAKRH